MTPTLLPRRYTNLRQNEAGDALNITEGESRAISIPLAATAFGGLVLLWWLSTDQLKKDRAARKNPDVVYDPLAALR